MQDPLNFHTSPLSRSRPPSLVPSPRLTSFPVPLLAVTRLHQERGSDPPLWVLLYSQFNAHTGETGRDLVFWLEVAAAQLLCTPCLPATCRFQVSLPHHPTDQHPSPAGLTGAACAGSSPCDHSCCLTSSSLLPHEPCAESDTGFASPASTVRNFRSRLLWPTWPLAQGQLHLSEPLTHFSPWDRLLRARPRPHLLTDLWSSSISSCKVSDKGK